MRNIKQLSLTITVSVLTALATLYFGKAYIMEQLPQLTESPAEIAQPIKFTNYVPGPTTQEGLTDFTHAAKLATPGVVHVKTLSVQSPANHQPHPLEQLFGYRFGNPQNQPRRASGSGVIISSDGYIVTNNHVIKEADEIEISLNNNKSYKAELIGSDPNTDLALLK
ncbi:MAG: trypsin-like peptidase domain-containing protein, partial [Chitinophagales bacterium]